MISKTIVHSFIILLIATGVPKSQAQEQNREHEVVRLGLESITPNSNYSKTLHFFEGRIKLKDSTYFFGEICLNQLDKNQKYAAILRIDECAFYIPNATIKNIVLQQVLDKKNMKTKFISIDKEDKLFREVYKKDPNTIVYDLKESPFDGKTLNDVHIMDNGNLLEIYKLTPSGPKKDIINYLNKRDNKTYNRGDFKTLKDVFASL
jgi:hypothetical protein